jgi:hypothetical protein
MMWLGLRLQRSELFIVVGVLALAAALLVPTGLHMASVFDRNGVGRCVTQSSPGCSATIAAFQQRFDSLGSLMSWFNLVPGIVGALLAAPLVLDFENATFRLAWTQSVSRRRWVLSRLLVVLLTALAVSLVFTTLMTWWRGPLDSVGERLSDGFEFEGLAPASYTLFAAALVLAVGVVLRRTATAIGVGIVGFLAMRIAVDGWVRPHYLEPVRRSWTTGTGPNLHGAWLIEETSRFERLHGHVADPGAIAACLDPGKKFPDAACLATHGIVFVRTAVYQPASRFWVLQGFEAALFAGLAVALAAFSAWWIQRRLA